MKRFGKSVRVLFKIKPICNLHEGSLKSTYFVIIVAEYYKRALILAHEINSFVVYGHCNQLLNGDNIFLWIYRVTYYTYYLFL